MKHISVVVVMAVYYVTVWYGREDCRLIEGMLRVLRYAR